MLAYHLLGRLTPQLKSLPCFSTLSLGFIGLLCGEQSKLWLGNSHVWMWELGHKEGWVRKNWCFHSVVLEKTLESPLDCKKIQPVHSEGDKPWDFFGRNDAKAETPVLWAPYAKSWLIGKDSDAGRDWGQEEKGTTEDEMAGWHHWLNGWESEWTPGVGDGQGGLVCCDSWYCKESDTTERLNWTELNAGRANLWASFWEIPLKFLPTSPRKTETGEVWKVDSSFCSLTDKMQLKWQQDSVWVYE